MDTLTKKRIFGRWPGSLTLIGPLPILVFAYIILTPSLDLIPGLGSYDEKRVLECALLVFGAFHLLLSRSLQLEFSALFAGFSGTQRGGMITIFVLGLLSSLYATDVQKAILDVSLFMLLFINCLLLALHWRRHATQSLLLLSHALLIAAGFYLVAFLAAYAAANTHGVSREHWDLFVNFAHVRFLSQFQSWTLPLIVLPLFLSERFSRGPGHWTSIFIAGGWWLILFSSGTRGTLVGLVIAGCVTAWVYGRRALPWFKWQALTLCLGLLLYCLMFLLPPLLGGMDTNAIQQGTIGRSLTNPHGRLHLWQVALTMIADHPVLGVGPMHYACGVTNGIAAHPHDAVLQLAAEWGLPAFLMIAFLWISGVRAWIRQALLPVKEDQNIGHPVIYPALLASLLTASIHALFSGVIVMPLSQVTMILVIGCMLGIHRQQSRPVTAAPPNHDNTMILLAIISFAVVGLTSGILPDVPVTGDLFNTAHIPEGARWLMPRFWQQGLICG
jgi:O-antigen ligase